MPSNIDWDRVEAGQRTGGSRHYPSATCPICGRTISEGAYTGKSGNLRKHLAAHDKKKEAKR